MSTGPDRLPDKDALMRFAGSEKGKALISQLNKTDPDMLKSAAKKAAAGDLASAMNILRAILSPNEGLKNGEVADGK